MTRCRAIFCYCFACLFLPLAGHAQAGSWPTPSISSGDTPLAPTVSVRELNIPDKAKRAYQKGVGRIAARDWAGSIPDFEKAIKAYGDLYEAYYRIGFARLQLHQVDAAGNAFRKAIELSEGTYAPAFFGLGVVFSAAGEYQEAAEVVQSGLNMAPMDAGGHCTLAWILYSLQRINEAEYSAQQAVRWNPNFAMARLMLAEIHRTQNKLPDLIEDLTIYLRLDPNGPKSVLARQLLDKAQPAVRN